MFVPDADVLGEIGNGWHQVSYERSGPELILSTAPLIAAAFRVLSSHSDSDDRTSTAVGDLMAQLISLRQLSISVARELADGGDAAQRAALVKDMGTRFEQDTIDAIDDLLAYSPLIGRYGRC